MSFQVKTDHIRMFRGETPLNATRKHCAAFFVGVADHQPHPWFASHEPFWCPGNTPAVDWPDKCPRCGEAGPLNEATGPIPERGAMVQPVGSCTHEFHS